MPIDRTGQPWSGATYNGFAGPPPAQPAPAATSSPRESRSPTKGLLIGGLAAAITGGLLFGLWARPDFGEDGRAREPVRSAPVAAAPMQPAPSQVPIEVAPVTPVPAPAAPRAQPPLEVLSPDAVRSAEASRPVAPPPVARTAPPAPAVARAPAAPPRVERDFAVAPRTAPVIPARPPVVTEEPRRLARNDGPAFNCRLARSRSEQMVCGDSELAALDRRLNRAFTRAVGSGVPYRELRREQDDWLSIREDAARRSPDAVASVYRQRIRELNGIAAGDEPFD